jgi:hypothetical protein
LGYLDPFWRYRFGPTFTALLWSPSPAFLRKRVHPLMRFYSSSKFSGFLSDRRIPTSASYLGVLTHFATLVAGVHPVSQASQAPHVPPMSFLTTPTVYSSIYLAGLFHPAATYWVCSVGVFPLTQPFELVARRCPLVVCAFFLPSADQRHQNQACAFRALLRVKIRAGLLVV